jgi:hypothetical protein
VAAAGREIEPGVMISWRYQAAARLAVSYKSAAAEMHLAIVGDGALRAKLDLEHGAFNAQAVEYYHSLGVEFDGVHAICNGGHVDMSLVNTKGDMRALALFAAEHGFDVVVVVSCWYHMPRVWANWRQMWRAHVGGRPPTFVPHAVPRDIYLGLRNLRGEMRGTVDALRAKPQRSRPRPIEHA